MLFHIETRHQQPSIKCDKCPQSFQTCDALVRHIEESHSRNQQRQRNTLDNGVWTCAFCGTVSTGTESRDSHICSNHTFQTVEQQQRRQTRSHEVCKRGEQCHHLKLGKCWYYHAPRVETSIWSEVQNRDTRRSNVWCSFQDRCNRRETCVYKHMDEERNFLQNVLRRTEQ